jgi:hypothetical protein
VLGVVQVVSLLQVMCLENYPRGMMECTCVREEAVVEG